MLGSWLRQAITATMAAGALAACAGAGAPEAPLAAGVSRLTQDGGPEDAGARPDLALVCEPRWLPYTEQSDAPHSCLAEQPPPDAGDGPPCCVPLGREGCAPQAWAPRLTGAHCCAGTCTPPAALDVDAGCWWTCR